ncbi:hypothetical protein [Caballeronia glebae]|uniref:hypothetical protein n=1 Tax=Caballeronia glebae TaxID=1777143 RepID=UPI000AF75C56|nr:hypothetical protein [Caballeronia glebae]
MGDASCLRLIRALCSETHETWLQNSRYLNMALSAEQKKEFLRALLRGGRAALGAAGHAVRAARRTPHAARKDQLKPPASDFCTT